MRHIPEDELHAYLDQALSRAQCVEIESHLAACAPCSDARDGIAALRDRTTALLAVLSPKPTLRPSFEELRRRHVAGQRIHQKRVRVVAWAASLVAAVGLGWSAASISREDAATAPAERLASADRAPVVEPPSASAPAEPPTAAPARPDAVVPSPVLTASGSSTPTSPRSRTPIPATFDSARVVAAAESITADRIEPQLAEGSVELAPLTTSGDLPIQGVWRRVSWDGAQAAAGRDLPHIDGLPVVDVQLQSTQQGKKPLMVVAQQLASGEVIRTIEGPVRDVSQLLSRGDMTDPEPTDTAASRRAPRQTDGTMAMQRGDRMLAITGAIPPDSLRAMIRRLNAELRTRDDQR